MIRLFNGDCLEIMDMLIDWKVKVDAIIADPPYNIVEKNGGSIHLFRQSKVNGNNNFSEETMSYDIGFDQLEWLNRIPKLLNRGGHIVIFNDWENMGDIAKKLRQLKIKIKSLNFWQKTNPQPAEWKRRFVSGREYFLHALRSGKYVFNVNALHKGVFEMGLTSRAEKTFGFHPNQKPIQLMEGIIKILTTENQTILDPFMGSGTTGVACKNLNRNFIGIELEEKYFKIAKKRINNVL